MGDDIPSFASFHATSQWDSRTAIAAVRREIASFTASSITSLNVRVACVYKVLIVSAGYLAANLLTDFEIEIELPIEGYHAAVTFGGNPHDEAVWFSRTLQNFVVLLYHNLPVPGLREAWPEMRLSLWQQCLQYLNSDPDLNDFILLDLCWKLQGCMNGTPAGAVQGMLALWQEVSSIERSPVERALYDGPDPFRYFLGEDLFEPKNDLLDNDFDDDFDDTSIEQSAHYEPPNPISLLAPVRSTYSKLPSWLETHGARLDRLRARQAVLAEAATIDVAELEKVQRVIAQIENHS